MTAPWWTVADDAELAVLVQEFVGGELEHRERCSLCSQGGPYCKAIREAFDVVTDWVERRRAASFAAAMRRIEDA